MPKTGFAGFKENWKSDLLSGFLVSLIALPLSLGIAKASGFPPIMGVLTAMVGGIIVAFFAGSELTIKGPAAGLIVICAGAVDDLGAAAMKAGITLGYGTLDAVAKAADAMGMKPDQFLGWHLALGVVVVAALVQILFGLLKVAKLADFFPLSAVHGMLAAIGIIIMSKQIHTAIGINPAELKGKAPLELLGMIPHSIANMNVHIAIIGLVSLLIMFGMPMIKSKIVKKIPPALIVLITAVILGKVFNLGDETFKSLKPLVDPGTFAIHWNVVFDAFTNSELLGIALKYLLMFALIGSLESLLTGKAIDLLDPYQRKSDLSKDLTGVGIGNAISGILGGLPMISEVARSSANIGNEGKTRWANFFHGLFLLLFVVALVPLIKMVPNAALSAILIFVGFRLAHPREFAHTWHIGKEQLAIFLVTIVATLATDLLIGIGAGILLKYIIHAANGMHVGSSFKSDYQIIEKSSGNFVLSVNKSAVFTNYLGLKKGLAKLPAKQTVEIDFSNCSLVDHTVMKNVSQFMKDYNADGGKLSITGLHNHKSMSHDALSTKKIVK